VKVRVGLAGALTALLVLVVSVALGSAAPTAKRAAALAPIVLGSTCDCTGVVSSSGAGWTPAINVWADYVNAHGGILGHKVKVISLDTQSSSTTAVTDAKQLLDQDKVVAMFPGASQMAIIAPVITAAKAPIIGGQGTDAAFSSPYWFPATTTPNNLIAAIIKAGSQGQKTPHGGEIYCVESPSCAASAAVLGQAVTAAGQASLFTASIAATAPSYAAQCLAAQSAGVNYIFVADAAAITNRVISDCATQNYFPTWTTPQFDVSFLTNPDLTKGNMVDIASDALYNSPKAKTVLQAVAKYDPSIINQPTFGPYSYQAWLSGELLVTALEKAKPTGKTITRADVFKGLYMLKNETLGGQTPPLTFKKGSPPNVKCFYEGIVKNGKLVPKGGPQCL
jgi:branched-chain amino acid transport system substrate-binding protein